MESVSPSGRVGKGILVHYKYNVFYDAPKDLQKENQSLIPVQYMVVHLPEEACKSDVERSFAVQKPFSQ